MSIYGHVSFMTKNSTSYQPRTPLLGIYSIEMHHGTVYNSHTAAAAAAAAKSLHSCPTLCDLVDGSPPGSSIHGVFKARVLEWGEAEISRFRSLVNFLKDITWA